MTIFKISHLSIGTAFKLLLAILLFTSAQAFAQNHDAGSDDQLVSAAPTSCITEGENIGQHIVEYVLCGASLTNQQDTITGAVLLILCTMCLGVSLFMMSWNGLKYIFFSMQKGVPGGDKVLGGIVVLRSALLISFLVPIISNGYAPVNVMMRSMTEIGVAAGDSSAVAGSTFLDKHDGYGNSGVTGVSKVSQQIILSTLCAKNFDIYNNEQLIQNEQFSVQKRILVSSSSITIRWDIVNGSDSLSYNESDAGISLTDENGACGEVIFNLHDYLEGHASVNGSTLSFSDLSPSQELYVRPAIDQYNALLTHIEDVETILADSSVDLIAGVQATAIRSTMDSSRIGESEELIYQAESGLQQSKQLMRELTVDLINSSFNYERAVIQAGKDAALRVRETDTAFGCLPTGPVNSKIFNSVTYERPDLHLTTCEAGGETWADKIAVQGFLALPLYYTSILELNQRILAIQKHYSEAEVDTHLYSEKSSFTHRAMMHIQKASEPYARLASRTNSILMMFANTRQKSEFNMDFSVAETSRVTVAELEDDSALGSANKWLSSIGAYLSTFIFEQLRRFSDEGDIVLTLINIGTGIMMGAEWLLVIAGGIVIAGFFASWGLRALLAIKNRIGKAVDQASNAADSDTSGSNKSDDSSSGIVGILFWAILFMIVVGGMLMYGIPFLFLFKWVLEMQSWAIMMFIAQIYAPLWIMAHASITDERFMHEHTLSGYGLMFELTLRPMLLVISFFSIFVIMYISGIAMKMVSSAMIGVASGGTHGILGIIIIFILVLFAALQMVFRTFDLLSIITDKVLQRFSFGSSPLGDVAQDKTHSSFGAFIQKQASSPHGVGARAAKDIASKLGFIPTQRA